ncbi:type IV pilus biogenesis protein PilM [Sporosarcina siberiensis]|uniref:Type IV pilus biogenesis protein PilM n=1 Tax=Sporosarcina siberiensis TaxID=1365606 RepID=A0ABW4SDD4_9BACL
MFRRKNNRVVTMEVNDYAIRALSLADDDLETAVLGEYVLAPGIVVDDVVKDELAFFDVLKEITKAWNITKYDLRFFVPDHAVMMRVFNHPKETPLVGLKAYVEMELGRTIHLPFENPLIDVYNHKGNEEESVIFAAPAEESIKLIQLYEDVQLQPTVLDVRALSNIRFLNSTSQFEPARTYLIVDLSMNAVSISIYTDGNVEFLRYQPSEHPNRNWRYGTIKNGENVYTYNGDVEQYRIEINAQIYEIERILNFYKFSLNKGEKSVDEIIIMGYNPEIRYFSEQIKIIIDLPLTVIDDAYVQKRYPQFNAKYVALIGLALKGGASIGS